ncbi:MAG TPA: RDD family protein [Gaiellaceae bacterium]|nr:RDD family protein [Gaiellaceae bacterium]
MVATTAAIQPGLSEGRVPYAGVATRAVALAADLLVIHVFILVVGALLGLVASLVGDLRPEWLVATLVGAAWGLTVTIYFVLFWSITGQTPGMRAMRLRVVTADATPPSSARALVRLVGLLLAIVPLFAGFLPVLFDSRRRALPDYLARTVVLYADRAEAHGVVTGGP